MSAIVKRLYSVLWMVTSSIEYTYAGRSTLAISIASAIAGGYAGLSAGTPFRYLNVPSLSRNTLSCLG